MDRTTIGASAAETRKHDIEAALAAHSGSLERIRHWTRRLIYTPGVGDAAERCGAYWLIDLIASHQLDTRVAAEAFQVWRLRVAADRSATATAEDGNDNGLASQPIEYTDFPLDEITLYLDQGTLMLPGEY